LGRILALDYGKRRIGLAVSDALGITAQGLETLVRTRIREDLARLRRIAGEYEIERAIIGNPIRMSGEEGRASEAVREFAARLEPELGCPVELWDERLTSAEANRILDTQVMKREARKGVVDRMAAMLILESYLTARAFHPDLE
jgi:putative Holliday junction resolvase